MIKVLSMNPSGIDGIRTIMTFEFTFDNPNELPKSGVYTMNQVIYLIANNSIAINNKDNSVYKFNGKQWIKTGDKITPNNMNNITSNGNYILSSSPVSNNTNVSVNVENEPNIGDLSVTANGVYNASDEGLDGYLSVDVDVSTVGTPKLVTPTALTTLVNRGITFIQSLNNKKTNVELSPMCCNTNGPSSYEIYTVCTTPINSVTFKFCPSNREGYSNGGKTYILFVASSNTFTGYYYDSNFSKETINSTSVTTGKTYMATFTPYYGGSATMLYFDFNGITEYNEPITFTVE